MKIAMPACLKLANYVDVGNDASRLRFVLLQLCNVRAPIWFQYACSSLMATNAL